MRKKCLFYIYFGLLVLISLALLSCQNLGTDTQQDTETTERTYHLGEEFVVNNITFIVEKAEKMEEVSNIKPLEEEQFIAVYLSFEGDIVNQADRFDPASVKITDERANQFDAYEPSEAISLLCEIKNRKSLSECMLNDGERVKVVELFKVPKRARGLNLEFVGWEEKNIITFAEVDLELD